MCPSNGSPKKLGYVRYMRNYFTLCVYHHTFHKTSSKNLLSHLAWREHSDSVKRMLRWSNAWRALMAFAYPSSASVDGMGYITRFWSAFGAEPMLSTDQSIVVHLGSLSCRLDLVEANSLHAAPLALLRALFVQRHDSSGP